MAVLSLALVASAVCAATDRARDGQAVVRIQAGASIEDAMAQLEALAPGVSFTVDDAALAGRRIYMLSYSPGTATDEVADTLALWENDPGNGTAIWGDLLYEGQNPEGRTGSVWFHSVLGGLGYYDQYSATMLGLGPAHQVSTGGTTVVAILDTGIDATHPELQGHVINGG